MSHAAPRCLLLLTALGCAVAAPRPDAGRPPRETPRSPSALSQAHAHLRAGRNAEAARLAASIAEKHPEMAEAYWVWGRSLALLNKLPESVLQYERARALGGQQRRLFLELASIYDVTQQYDKAVAVYRDYLQKQPNDIEAQHQLGLSLLLQRKWQAASTHLSDAVAERPQDAQLREDLGHALVGARQFEQAVSHLEVALHLDPQRVTTMELLARAAIGLGDSNGALQWLDRAIAIPAQQPSQAAVALRARLRCATGDATGGLEDYKQWLAMAPHDPTAWSGAIGAFIQLGKLKEAQRALQKAQQTVNEEHEGLRFRADQLAWRRGDQQAIGRIAAFAREHPGAKDAWEELHRAAKDAGMKALVREARSQLRTLRERK